MIGKTTTIRLLRFISQNKYIFLALLICASLAGVVAFRLSASQALQYVEDNPTPTEHTAVIRVDSNVQTVAVHGEPNCDSQKLKETLPYSCVLGEKELAATLTADQEVTHEGKKYHFKTWDGCSFAHSSKYICRVTGQIGKTSQVKVTYAEGALPQSEAPKQDDKPQAPSGSSPTSSKPNATPNPCQPTPFSHRNKQHSGDDLFEQYYGYCSVPVKANTTITLVQQEAQNAVTEQWITCYADAYVIDSNACTRTDEAGNIRKAGLNTPMYVQPGYKITIHSDTTLVMSAGKTTSHCVSIPFSKVPICHEKYNLANWTFTQPLPNTYSLGPIYAFECNYQKAPLCSSN